MRTLDQIVEDGKPRATFLDSADYEAFVARQCDRCIYDSVVCPLIDAAFLGFTPVEWVPGKTHKYRCKERRPIPAAA